MAKFIRKILEYSNKTITDKLQQKWREVSIQKWSENLNKNGRKFQKRKNN